MQVHNTVKITYFESNELSALYNYSVQLFWITTFQDWLVLPFVFLFEIFFKDFMSITDKMSRSVCWETATFPDDCLKDYFSDSSQLFFSKLSKQTPHPLDFRVLVIIFRISKHRATINHTRLSPHFTYLETHSDAACLAFYFREALVSPRRHTGGRAAPRAAPAGTAGRLTAGSSFTRALTKRIAH